MDFDTNLQQTELIPHERFNHYRMLWQLAHSRRHFIKNEFGYSCNICDRIWFKKDLKPINATVAAFVARHFQDENVVNFELSGNCQNRAERATFRRWTAPTTTSIHLSSIWLISPRIFYVQISLLHRKEGNGIVERVINMLGNVQTIVRCLLRSFHDDHTFNVNLKQNILQHSTFLSDFVQKSLVQACWRNFVIQPLYKHYNITINVNIRSFG